MTAFPLSRRAFVAGAASLASAAALGLAGCTPEDEAPSPAPDATPGASAADRLATGACGMPLQGASV